MTISIRQIRAARGLLGWSQSDLAESSGLSKNGICDLEMGKVLPRTQTLEKLQRCFETHGIQFALHDGVQMRQDIFHVTHYEGKNIFGNYFQDLIETMRQQKVMALHHSDDAAFAKSYPNEFFWYYSQMLKHDLKERLLIPDNKLFRYAPYSTTECRLCPRDVFGTVGYSVYGDKFALYMPNRLVVIENKEIAETYRQQFKFDWNRAQKMPNIPPQFEAELKKRKLQKSN
jgi:transcriptional regulator with XRE-family HTH domain